MDNLYKQLLCSPLTGAASDFAAKLISEEGYEIHHTASAMGYISRKDGYYEVEEYHGRFGDGYKIHTPSRRSNQYHDVTYLIKYWEV